MTVKLSEAQKALVKIMASGWASPRFMDRKTLADNGLLAEFKLVQHAGLIQDAGYECSPSGDSFLDSPTGRAALSSERKGE